MISEEIKSKIIKIVNAAETSVPSGDYGKLVIANDGPGLVRQISYGRSQVTELNGVLNLLIEKYCTKGGDYGKEFEPYLGRIGKPPSLAGDPRFIRLLKSAALDPIMKQSQDEIFEEKYWKPTEKFFLKWGLSLPLSFLIIYDTIIQSGPSVEHPKSIVPSLRRSFSERVPSEGGNEKKWVESYLRARHHWLSNNSRADLRRSSYRTKCYIKILESGNWVLKGDVNMNGSIIR
jgi:chitosanase